MSSIVTFKAAERQCLEDHFILLRTPRWLLRPLWKRKMKMGTNVKVILWAKIESPWLLVLWHLNTVNCACTFCLIARVGMYFLHFVELWCDFGIVRDPPLQISTTSDIHHIRQPPHQTSTTPCVKKDTHHTRLTSPCVKKDTHHNRHSPHQTSTTPDIHHITHPPHHV